MKYFNPPLNLPECEVNIVQTDKGQLIYDKFRNKYVALTQEEWVRQNFLLWLVNHLGYPKGLIGVEAALRYNKLHKRADAVVYDKSGRAKMIIECKSPQIKLTTDTILQAAVYNTNFKCKFLVITNGVNHYCLKLDSDGKSFCPMDKIPCYNEL